MLDWKKFVEEKSRENWETVCRMDEDLDLAVGAHYTLKDASGWRIKGIYNVTLPEPKLFAHRAITRLASVERRTVVESDSLPDEKTTRIEHFLDDLAYEADVLRTARGEPDIFSKHCETVCLRGPIAEQVILRVQDAWARASLIADVRPLDTRNFVYESGPEGITRCAVIMRRGARDIADEYEGIMVKGSTGEVWDCWDAASESVFIDGRLVMENPNTYGEAPFVVQWPAAGVSLPDSLGKTRRGESIFFLTRSDDGTNIWDELNYIASILKTQAAETMHPPVQLPAPPDGEYQEIPPNYPGPGEIVQVKQPMQLVPKPDVRESTRMYYNLIERVRQLGTFSLLDSGVMEFPLSAVAYQQALSRRNELLLPRLQAVAQLQQSAARMKIRQFMGMGRMLRLGEPGHQRTYTPDDLAGEYTIKFSYRADAAESRASDLAYANAARGFYSEDTIRRDILKMPDPGGEQAKFDAEAVRKADPVIGLFEQLCGLIRGQEKAADIEMKMVKDLEARSLLSTILGIIRQRKATEAQPMRQDIQQAAVNEAAGEQLLNVFGGKNSTVGGI